MCIHWNVITGQKAGMLSVSSERPTGVIHPSTAVQDARAQIASESPPGLPCPNGCPVALALLYPRRAFG